MLATVGLRGGAQTAAMFGVRTPLQGANYALTAVSSRPTVSTVQRLIHTGRSARRTHLTHLSSFRKTLPNSSYTKNATRSLSLWPFASKKMEETHNLASVDSTPESTLDSPLQSSAFDTSSTSATPSSELVHEAQDAMSHATEHVQTLADLGQISNWANVRAVQSLMDWLVEATGMPWWLTIAAVTLSVRVVVLPLVLYGQKNAIRMANIQPKMQAHMADINHAKSTGDKQLLVKSVESVQKLMKDNDCHPLRSFAAPVIQAPLFMTFFFALRGLGEAGLPSMKTGGLAWFSDLTSADPFYILPVLSSLTMLATLETGAEMGAAPGAQQTQQQVTMRWVMRFVLVAAIPFISWMPAAVFCYWVTNGLISLLQLWTLNRRPVRRLLNLPQQAQHSKEDLKIKERAGSKPMKFWDAVSTGMTSQQDPATVRVIRRDQAPSALKNLNEDRERALNRLRGVNEDKRPSQK